VLHDGRVHRLLPGPAPALDGKIQAVKLKESPSQSYWKGKEGNPEMQRIYGYAFFTKNELDAHLKKLEEAKRATIAAWAASWTSSPSRTRRRASSSGIRRAASFG